jgi:hypothetical protein
MAHPEQPPPGAAVVYSYAGIRKQYVVAAVGLPLVGVLVMVMIWMALSPALPDAGGPVVVLALVAAGGGPFFLLGLLSYRAGPRVVDLEVAPGQMRLPLRKHRDRRGWRDTSEVWLLAVDASVPTVAAAKALVDKMDVGKLERQNYHQCVRVWENSRCLLVITTDEAIVLSGDRAAFDILCSHWMAERTRQNSQARQPG